MSDAPNILSPSFPQGLPKMRSEAEVRAARGLTMLDVIRGGAHRGMSDEQRDNEHGCMKRLQSAVIEMTKALEMINHESAVQSVSIPEWETFIHDSLPDFGQWDEKISIARRG